MTCRARKRAVGVLPTGSRGGTPDTRGSRRSLGRTTARLPVVEVRVESGLRDLLGNLS